METSVASEPLNFFMIVICELLPTYSFLLPFSDCSFEKVVALTTKRNGTYVTILLNALKQSYKWPLFNFFFSDLALMILK